MPTIFRENHDTVNATLTLSIPVEDYKSEFIKKLKEIQKKAHLKGFRKGKHRFPLFGKCTVDPPLPI